MKGTQWMDQARCITITPRHWDQITLINRRRICARCPVLNDCQTFLGADHLLPARTG